MNTLKEQYILEVAEKRLGTNYLDSALADALSLLSGYRYKNQPVSARHVALVDVLIHHARKQFSDSSMMGERQRVLDAIEKDIYTNGISTMPDIAATENSIE